MDAPVLTISRDNAAAMPLESFMFRRLARVAALGLCGLGLAVLAPAAMAQTWGTIANISSTMGVNDGRLCLGEGSRQDLGCPTYAPFVDRATGNVGIGNTGPIEGLFVGSPASSLNIGLVRSDTAGAIRWYDTSGTVLNAIRSLSTNDMQIVVSKSEVMRIGASGNIGISTTNPNAKLDVYGVVSATQFRGDGSLLTGISTQGDRITSGTTSLVAISSTGYISLTQASTNTAWFDPTRGLVTLGVSATGVISASGFRTPGAISASVISATAIQLVSQSTTPVACNTGNAGTLRYNSPTTSLELCTGSGWQPMGVGIPAGTISAFASTTCPLGWSEYTPARGRFLRGIDNGAGNDPSGTRVPGNSQHDALQSHNHEFDFANRISFSGMYINRVDRSIDSANSLSRGVVGNPAVSGARTATETRPVNVAVTFCQFNGTSNGWNNPLSGGSGGTPAGSTGQLQYNTAGAFDASAALTFDNASSRLTTTNISATAVTVAGRVSASVVQIGDDGTACSAATKGTIRIDPVSGKVQICRQL